MKVLYHIDHDGQLAAHWVGKAFNLLKLVSPWIPMDYGAYNMKDILNKIDHGEEVWIVDFSLEPEEMKILLNRTSNVIWIDHHITSIKKYENFEFDIKGLRNTDYAGCMLTWCYIYCMKMGKKEFNDNMPMRADWVTKFCSDYDTWKYEYGQKSYYWHLGMLTKDTEPYDTIWEDSMDDNIVFDIIGKGRTIADFVQKTSEVRCKQYGFEYKKDGYTIFCLNNCFGGSDYFGDFIKDYDMVCSFVYNGKNDIWEYSMYSDKDEINIPEIFPEFQGHPHACGYISKRFIF